MNVQHVLSAALVAVGLVSTAAAQTSPATGSCDLEAAPGVTEQRLSSGGRERGYRLFVPPSYDGRTPLPLVLDLHGSGGTAAGQANTSRFEALAAREGFLVATLEAAEGRRWNVPATDDRADDVLYVSDVIDHVAARACTDLARVYATGFSGGARMSSLLACRLGDRVAAIAPMAGLRWPGPCEGRPVPVLTFHGLADRVNTYDGHAEGRGAEWLESVPEALAGWAAHNGCDPDAISDDEPGPLSTLRYEGCDDGAEVRLVRIDGLGHAWARDEVDATSAMWEFFGRHSLRQ
ncbi:MAG TPA: PHB depolymerase family esterase [Gammaproteobacteria bacterium]